MSQTCHCVVPGMWITFKTSVPLPLVLPSCAILSSRRVRATRDATMLVFVGPLCILLRCELLGMVCSPVLVCRIVYAAASGVRVLCCSVRCPRHGTAHDSRSGRHALATGPDDEPQEQVVSHCCGLCPNRFQTLNKGREGHVDDLFGEPLHVH